MLLISAIMLAVSGHVLTCFIFLPGRKHQCSVLFFMSFSSLEYGRGMRLVMSGLHDFDFWSSIGHVTCSTQLLGLNKELDLTCSLYSPYVARLNVAGYQNSSAALKQSCLIRSDCGRGDQHK